MVQNLELRGDITDICTNKAESIMFGGEMVRGGVVGKKSDDSRNMDFPELLAVLSIISRSLSDMLMKYVLWN